MIFRNTNKSGNRCINTTVRRITCKPAVSLLTLGLVTTLSLCARFSHAQALANKADAFLTRVAQEPAQTGWTSVIARMNSELTPQQQKQLIGTGADIYRHLPLIHSVALRVPTCNLNKLASLSFVQHLSAEMSVRKCDQFTTGSSGATVAWAAPYNVSGSGVTVAVVNSGLTNTIDFGSTSGKGIRLLYTINFLTGAASTGSTGDQCGHGQHVGGIIAGNGAASSGSNSTQMFTGVAPQANLVGVRVLDQNGQGNVSNVVAGIQWVVANKSKYNIRVINLSLGHAVGESYTTDPLCQAVEQAWKAGIVVVCAAGNAGRLNTTNTPGLDNEGWGTAYGSIQSPGNDPYVITVGAMKAPDMTYIGNGQYTHNRNNDQIATYSSRGPSRLDLVMKPDILAPGNKIISMGAKNDTLDLNYASTNEVPYALFLSGNGQSTAGRTYQYFVLSGTSMAAPVVSGAAALLLQANPNLTPDTIKARLMLSADKWADPNGNQDPCTYGAGYLNIVNALKCTALPRQAALSPTLSQDNDGDVFINMDRAIWGTDVNGQRALWGVNSVNDLRAVWGTRAIWGTSDNLLNASRALWGTNVWSDRAIWGTSSSAVDLTSTAINGE